MGADTELLESRIIEGDDAAFSSLLSRCAGRLSRMIQLRVDRRILGRVDVADVLQDVFAEATVRLAEYRANPSMKMFLWLRFLAAQRLVQIHRWHLGAEKRDVRLESPWNRDHPATSALALELSSTSTTPSEANIRRESVDVVRQALERLTDEEREVLGLRHYEQLTNAEAARELGMSESGASYRYVSALKALKSRLIEIVGPDAGSCL